MTDNSLPLFFYGLSNRSADYVIKSRVNFGHYFDFLIFFDSRGVSSQYEGSLADLLVKYFEKRNISYLLVNRPLEITTWCSLYNFLSANEITFNNLITNMGFVDFTPKKIEIINEVCSQLAFKMRDVAYDVIFRQKYLLSNGREESIYTIRYNQLYFEKINKMIGKFNTILINTPKVTESIVLKRARPKSFFNCVQDTISFNNSLFNASTILNFEDFTTKETYDGVHYTYIGNHAIFDQVRNVL